VAQRLGTCLFTASHGLEIPNSDEKCIGLANQHRLTVRKQPSVLTAEEIRTLLSTRNGVSASDCGDSVAEMRKSVEALYAVEDEVGYARLKDNRGGSMLQYLFERKTLHELPAQHDSKVFFPQWDDEAKWLNPQVAPHIDMETVRQKFLSKGEVLVGDIRCKALKEGWARLKNRCILDSFAVCLPPEGKGQRDEPREEFCYFRMVVPGSMHNNYKTIGRGKLSPDGKKISEVDAIRKATTKMTIDLSWPRISCVCNTYQPGHAHGQVCVHRRARWRLSARGGAVAGAAQHRSGRRVERSHPGSVCLDRGLQTDLM